MLFLSLSLLYSKNSLASYFPSSFISWDEDERKNEGDEGGWVQVQGSHLDSLYSHSSFSPLNCLLMELLPK